MLSGDVLLEGGKVQVFYLLFISALAALAFTKHRTWVLVGFFLVYGTLKIMAQDVSASVSWSELLLFRALYPILLISVIVRFFKDPAFLSQARKWPLIAFAVFMVTVLAPALYSSSFHVFDDSTSNIFGQVAIISLFWLSAAHIQNQRGLYIFATSTVIASLGLSAWIGYSVARLDFSAFRGGVEVNQNFVSLYVLAGAIPLLHALFNVSGLWRKTGILALLGIVLAGAMLLASRGVLIAFFVAALVMAPQLMPKHKIRAFAILAVLLCSSLLMPGVTDSLARFTDSDVTSGNGRSLVWKYSLGRFADDGLVKMLIGRGYNSSSVLLPAAMEPGSWNYHNDYLNSLMDSGVIGLSAFLVLLFFIWRKIRKTQHPLKNVMRGWVAFLIVSGMSGVISGIHIFWLLLGAICGACATPFEVWVKVAKPKKLHFAGFRKFMHEAVQDDLTSFQTSK